jgi:hypothetical protein
LQASVKNITCSGVFKISSSTDKINKYIYK